MNVLGLNINHHTSAAVVVNGKVVAAAEQERFNREKYTQALPLDAARFCLAQAGLQAADIDCVAVGHDATDDYSRTGEILRKVFLEGYPVSLLIKRARALKRYALRNPGKLRCKAPLSSAYWGKRLDWTLEQSKVDAPIKVVPHHRAHGAWASVPTGWKNAACLTVDGSGENDSSTAWRYEKNALEHLRHEPMLNSLGVMYEAFTLYEGFGVYNEGKTMGLAPYYGPRNVPKATLDEVIRGPGPKSPWYDVRLDSNRGPIGAAREELSGGEANIRCVERIFKNPHRPRDLLATTPPYPLAAATAQRALEDALLRVVKWTVEKTGEKKLCFGGGVAMNCSANGRIWESGLVDELAIQLAPMDQGTAAGAALEAARQAGDKLFVEPGKADWGPEFAEAEIEAALEAAGLKYERCPNGSIAGKAADLIAKGKIVGWFQGRMELGARALGHRSILANPCIKGMNDRVNRAKHRELWRPFAPSITAERLGEYVEKPCDSPYMLIAFHASGNGKRELPAVIHIDGTTRAQTVDKKQEPLYHKLLREVEGHTSHPAVLNTSYNDAGEPIVCTPQDAINSYLHMNLDALAIGNHLALNPRPKARA